MNYCITLTDSELLREGTDCPYNSYLRINDLKAEFKKMKTEDFTRIWPLEALDHSILVYIWVVDGNLDNDSMTIFGNVNESTNLDRRLINSLRNSEVSGYPCLMLYKNGEVVPPQPLVEDPVLAHAFLSAKRGDAESLKEVLPQLSDVDATDALGNTMLHYAASSGHLEVVQLLLESGANKNKQNEEGNTALILASANTRLDVVNELLAAKAKTEIRNESKNTAMHFASYFGHDAVVGALIDAKAFKNTRNGRDETPMIIAINERRNAVVKRLGEADVRWEQPKDNENRVLISMAGRGETEIVRFLLKERANPKAVERGVTALFAAAKVAEPELLRLLVEAGAEVDWKNTNGVTPLITAAYYGNCAGVEYLIEAGADVNHQNDKGVSALLGASANYHAECVRMLIEGGADPNATSESGTTAIEAATIIGSEEIVDMLLWAGAECKLDTVERAMPMMEYAFRHDIPQVVEIALDQCLTADFQFYGQFPAIWVANYYDNPKILKLLLDHNATDDESTYPKIAAIQDVKNQIKPLEIVRPEYPYGLQRRYGEQKVTVEIVIGEGGEALFPKVVDGDIPIINDKVIQAVSHWKFQPLFVDGEPAMARVRLPVLLEARDPDDYVFEIKELDKMPEAIKKVPPVYPRKLMRSGIQGVVTLLIVIDRDGKVSDATVESTSDPLFSEAALEAAKKWEFSPGYQGGEAVKVQMRLPIAFRFK